MATKTEKKTKAAFSEVKKNPPSILAKTKKKSGAKQANKQRVAIALSKARKAGANIPPAKKQITKQDVMKRMQERAQNA